MTPMPNHSAEVTAFAEALTASSKVRIPLRELWALWAAAAPRLTGHPDQVPSLAAALSHLDDLGLIKLPSTAWDISTAPPLPRSITVPGARTDRRTRRWTRFPWCAELGWVASLPSLSDARFDDLVAINDWLVRYHGRHGPIPMRYRSVQLFGDEKRLETIARTSLFGPGRLSLDMLACVRLPPPLAAAAVGSGPDLLVIENSDTYWTAVQVLRDCDTHPIGTVAWGAGRSFSAQVPTLTVDVAGRGPVRGTVWYWGDMDPEGLSIAASSAEAARAEAVEIRPPIALWAAMAQRPAQDRGSIDWTAEPGREWLGPELWERLALIRSVSGRVAQESVPASVMTDWAASR